MNETSPQERRQIWGAKQLSVVSVLAMVCAWSFWIGLARNTGTKVLLGDQETDSTNPALIVHTLSPMFIDELGIVEYQFPISNFSNRTIHIQDLRTSCSCAGASIVDNELKPSQQTVLIMKVDQRGRNETFAAECLVVHDAGEPLRCRLISPIYRRVEFIPSSVQLGVVHPGVGVEREVELLTHSRGKPVLDTNHQRRLTVVPTLVQKVDGGAVLHEEVSKDEELPGGIVSQRTPVRIHLHRLPSTAGPGCCEVVYSDKASTNPGEARLRINWFVDSPYKLDPNRIFFGSIKERNVRPPICKVKIQRRDGSAFRIMDLQCRSQEVTISCATIGSLEKRHEVTISVKINNSVGFLYDQVVVVTDDPAIPGLSIPLAASSR